MFSTRIKKNNVVCLYSGDYLHWTHVVGKSHAISVALHPGHSGYVICGRGVRGLVDRYPPALLGCIINSTEENSLLIDADANVKPIRDRFVLYKSFGKDKHNRDVGLAALAMVATRDIAPEEQILWSYCVTEMTDMTYAIAQDPRRSSEAEESYEEAHQTPASQVISRLHTLLANS